MITVDLKASFTLDSTRDLCRQFDTFGPIADRYIHGMTLQNVLYVSMTPHPSESPGVCVRSEHDEADVDDVRLGKADHHRPVRLR